MSELVITLLRVTCDEVTDDFLEGLTDEFGWRLIVWDGSDDKGTTSEEIPMRGMESVAAGSSHELNRELGRLGPECYRARLEFWDQDTFSADDLLGHIEIARSEDGDFVITAGRTASDLGGGSFHLTGEQGDYTVWLSFERR